MTTELVFDGDCGLCQACVRWLERRDGARHLNCLPSTSCTWDDAAAMPFATTVVVRTSTGETLTASSAVAYALSQLPGLWGLIGKYGLFLNRSPLLKQWHDTLYYAIATNRIVISNTLVRLRLLDESCRVPRS